MSVQTRPAPAINALERPWIDSPAFPRLLAESDLDARTRALVEHYATHGWVLVDPELPRSVLDGAVSDLRDRFKPGGDGYFSDERRVQDAWNFSENVRAIAAAPKIREILEILYRRPSFPFQSLNFRIGSEQRTHSDEAFFDSIPNGFMAAAWVALENVDESNGPLHYYPSSHRLPLYNLSDLGIVASDQTNPFEHMTVYEDFVESLMIESGIQRKTVHIEKGQAFLWSANLFHGGSPILDHARTRHSQVTHYYFGGCLYYTPLTSDPGIGRISPRLAFNAEAGRAVPQYYNGRLVENPGEWPPRLSGDRFTLDPMAYPTRPSRSVTRALKSRITRFRDRLR